MNLYSKIKSDLKKLKADHAFRSFKPAFQETVVNINLASNDYLDLAEDERLSKAFNATNKDLNLSASSSRLLTGNHKFYPLIESQLTQLYQSESALFFNSGYHLNIGVLPSITTKKDLILADKLVHASLIEAFKITTAKVIRYKHLDYKQLEALLAKYQFEYENIFIVSESVFSMDGDVVDLKQLVALKKKYKAYLYLDEAHAVGVCGNKGLGIAEKEGLISEVDFLVGTMGKALASVGAYIICKDIVKSYLINTCRSLIYTTALPPISVAWSYFIMQHISDFDKQRASLEKKSQYLREKLVEGGLEVRGTSHILALIVGDNSACLGLTQLLEKEGVKVQAIRPPTVPIGTSRIRISLHQKLTYQELDKVADLMLQINEK